MIEITDSGSDRYIQVTLDSMRIEFPRFGNKSNLDYIEYAAQAYKNRLDETINKLKTKLENNEKLF